jgi:hypothetical protein
MKHIYYGLTQKEVLLIDTIQAYDIRVKMDNPRIFHFNDNIIKLNIDALEKGHSHLIRTVFNTIDEEVYIAEREHEHVLEIDDTVELGEYKGRIIDKRYDAINDIMYYYTDITVETIRDENLEEQKESRRLKLLKEFKDLYEEAKRKSKEEKNVKTRGFLDWLLG